jgi:hypothetical protein
MNKPSHFYSNVLVKAEVGHKTNHGIINEIDNDGRVSTDDYVGTFIPSALSLVLDSKDIVKYQKIPHQDAQVTKALMSGHIIRVGDEEFRFAYKDQELYQTEEHTFIATDTGVYHRMMSYDGSDLSTPSGFIWVVYSDSFNVMQFLIERMTEDEKMAVIMDLSVDNALRNRG